MRRPDRTTIALAGVLLVALALRLWGIGHGLPFSYNIDEEGHFVPVAIGFFGHDLNPGYFLNPPGYTELLYAVYAVWYGGRDAVARAYVEGPGELFLIARATAAALGVVAVWLLYLAGARLLDRRVGLLAAAIAACAFLPVFYSHLALNDVPATAPATLALLGAALALRAERPRRLALAAAVGGVGAGLAAGTKYTAGIALLPVLTAVALRAWELGRAAATADRSVAHGEHAPAADRVPGAGAEGSPAARGRRAAGGRWLDAAAAACALALVAALAGFLAANPYALLDFDAFRAGVETQRTLTTADELPKVGLTEDNGVLYYLWTLTWGVGWAPALAAAAGGALLLARDRRLALVLLPAPLLFIAFMGSQERYFGRWLLPIVPLVALLAAAAGMAAIRALAARAGGRGRWLVPAAAAAVTAALVGQGLAASIHNDRVLSREDTRGEARAWLLKNVPAGTRVVIEPIAPERWLADPDRAAPATPTGRRWRVWDTTRADVDDFGRPLPGGRTRFVKVDKYVRTLRPALIDRYERRGFCWVVIGSTQFGRALAQPDLVPQAVAYYRELERRGGRVARFSPYDLEARPPAFNFDWSFNYYPRAYARPGPEIVVYRLRGGSCAGRGGVS